MVSFTLSIISAHSLMQPKDVHYKVILRPDTLRCYDAGGACFSLTKLWRGGERLASLLSCTARFRVKYTCKWPFAINPNSSLGRMGDE
jgi:hypothetical protein